MVSATELVSPEAVLRQAARYVERGWKVIPVPVRKKKPVLDGWPALRLTNDDLPRYFGRAASNVGVILGHVSGDLVDIDLDCPQAIEAAARVLVPTATFGRNSRPRSHWLYVSPDVEYLKCIDPIPEKDEAGQDSFQTLVELRTNAKDKSPGLQTVFPPSQHAGTGELIEWADKTEPVRIDAKELRQRVMRLAAVCLVMRHARDQEAKAAWLEKPTETPPPMPPAAFEKWREWMGLAKPKAPPRQALKSASSSHEFDDAVERYNRENQREYPANCSPCPICTSPDGFKASSVHGRWACFSSRHSMFKGRGIEGAGGVWTGDALDVDSFQWGRTRAEQLRECGFLTATSTRQPGELRALAVASTVEPAANDDPVEEWKPFPTDVLPEPLRTYVKQAAPANGADESMIAMQLLPLLASCIGTTRRARLKASWNERCALWCIMVCDSGQKKTPAHNEVMGLLNEHIQRATADHAAAVTAYKRDMETHRAERKSGEWEPPEIPAERRYVLRDATREAMVMRLRDNPRGLLLARDELAAWFKSFGAYKAGLGGDAENWLEMYNGGAQDVDRKGGAIEDRHIRVERALISVTGGIQPETLKRIISAEAIESGLLARFMMAMPPPRLGGWVDDIINPAVRAEVVRVVDWLMGLTFDSNGEPVDIPLSPPAHARWVWHVNRIASAIMETPVKSLKSAYAKIEGVAARLALVVHMVRAGAGENVETDVMDADSVNAGMALAWWLMDESRRVYVELGWAENPAKNMEEQLLNLLRAAPGGLTTTELHRHTHNKHKGGAMREALERMQAAGRVVGTKVPTEGNIKPTVRWAAVVPPQQDA